MEFSKKIKHYSKTYDFNCLSSLQFIYLDKNGNEFAEAKLGGYLNMKKENLERTEDMIIEENDFIKSIVLYYGSKFFPCIGFITNKHPDVKLFGYEELIEGKPTIVNLNKNSKIIGYYGKSGWVIDSIGFTILKTKSLKGIKKF